MMTNALMKHPLEPKDVLVLPISYSRAILLLRPKVESRASKTDAQNPDARLLRGESHAAGIACNPWVRVA